MMFIGKAAFTPNLAAGALCWQSIEKRGRRKTPKKKKGPAADQVILA